MYFLKFKSEKGGMKAFAVVLVLLIIIAGALLAMKVFKSNEEETVADNHTNLNVLQNNVEEQQKTLSGNSRPIAVMIDNNINAMPQAGLLEADIVYEIIVEGGETRLMLILQDKNVDKIGPIRSSRHYFLDYALENDAIYVHYGWSPQAESDITKYSVNNINGITESEESFWRTNERYAPHNVLTSIEDIMNIAKRKGYRTTTSQDTVLNYVVDEVELEDGEVANTVTIPYTSSNVVEYEYLPEEKMYVRYSRGEKQVDWTTGEDIKTKNIIIEKVENSTLNDGSNKGRQTIDNIKEVDGYYITNGKVIPIKCIKTSRTEQTEYRNLAGEEIDVNDGKTFIQICPEKANVGFEE